MMVRNLGMTVKISIRAPPTAPFPGLSEFPVCEDQDRSLLREAIVACFYTQKF